MNRLSKSALKKIRRLAVILSTALLAGYFGWYLGHRHLQIKWAAYQPKVEIINRTPPANNPVDFSLFWTVWHRLEKDYIDKGALDPRQMFYGAIQGMVASLNDPYTVFLKPEENKRSKEDLGGSFEGIGAQLGLRGNHIVIIAPLEGSPAKAAGVKAGDLIAKVNGQDAVGWTLPEAVDNIRGAQGTTVVLSVAREGEKDFLEISITRGTIIVPSVEYQTRQSPVFGYLKLSRFGERTEDEWDQAVSQFLQECAGSSCLGLILDLRNNPGGFLNGSIFLASEFLDTGLIVKQEHSNGQTDVFEVNRPGRLIKTPLVVLVNQGSASASEILAGALQKRGRSKIVGLQTFGKGSVQTPQDLPGGAGLHITTARWLLPDNSWINGTGITPDTIIKDNPETENIDEQLDKAIELLKS